MTQQDLPSFESQEQEAPPPPKKPKPKPTRKRKARKAVVPLPRAYRKTKKRRAIKPRKNAGFDKLDTGMSHKEFETAWNLLGMLAKFDTDAKIRILDKVRQVWT
jgi:hypothetical protein